MSENRPSQAIRQVHARKAILQWTTATAAGKLNPRSIRHKGGSAGVRLTEEKPRHRYSSTPWNAESGAAASTREPGPSGNECHALFLSHFTLAGSLGTSYYALCVHLLLCAIAAGHIANINCRAALFQFPRAYICMSLSSIHDRMCEWARRARRLYVCGEHRTSRPLLYQKSRERGAAAARDAAPGDTIGGTHQHCSNYRPFDLCIEAIGVGALRSYKYEGLLPKLSVLA